MIKSQLLAVTGLFLLSACTCTPEAGRPVSVSAEPSARGFEELGRSSWDIAYAGQGSIAFGPPGLVTLDSGVPAGPSATHGALVLLNRELPVGGYEVEVEYVLQSQLRSPNPNPWETFWLFFSYQPLTSGKTTNYVMVKPNGVEAGKAWGWIDQSFAFTAAEPRLKVGAVARLRVKVLPAGGARIFFQDGYVGEVAGDRIYSQAGRLGLYVEDARVLIRVVRFRWLDR